MTTHRLSLRPLALLGLVFCASACTQLEKVDDEGSGAAIPTRVQEAFDVQCATAGCHDSAAQQAGLDLTAAAAPSIIGGQPIQSSLPLVELGNVNGSYLAIKMLEVVPEGVTRSGNIMPQGGDLESPENAIILGWIAGASLPGGGGGIETDDGSMTDTGDDDGDTDEPATTTGSEIVACGLGDVAPDAPNPYDIGMNAGQIPPDVGEALVANCGCHEVESSDLEASVPPYTGEVHFATIADLQADHNGAPVHELVLSRVESETTGMPPSYYCKLDGGEAITAEDQALLIEWLGAGAPDATAWP